MLSGSQDNTSQIETGCMKASSGLSTIWRDESRGNTLLGWSTSQFFYAPDSGFVFESLPNYPKSKVSNIQYNRSGIRSMSQLVAMTTKHGAIS